MNVDAAISSSKNAAETASQQLPTSTVSEIPITTQRTINDQIQPPLHENASINTLPLPTNTPITSKPIPQAAPSKSTTVSDASISESNDGNTSPAPTPVKSNALQPRGVPIRLPTKRVLPETGEATASTSAQPTVNRKVPETEVIPDATDTASVQEQTDQNQQNLVQPTTKRRKVDKGKGIAIAIPGQRKKTNQADVNVNENEEAGPSQPNENLEGTENTKKGKKKRKSKKKSNDGEGANAEDDVINVDGEETRQPKKKGRKRAETPEDAHTQRIEPGVVKMLDLCKDTFIGEKSERYKEIEKIDWAELVRKQRARKAEIEAQRAAGNEVVVETVEQRLERLGRDNMAANEQQG